MKDFAKKFYHSKAWQKARLSYIADRRRIDGGLCEKCKKELGYIVHHKILLTAMNIDDPDVSLNQKNFEYVCKNCHDIYHEKEIYGNKKKKLLCIFDQNGQPIAK